MITNVPTTADSNIIISEPEGFNSCYLRHQQPGASTDKISVVINLKTYIFNGQRLVPLGDPQVITVNPNTTPFPITMVAKLPNNGTAAAIEVTIQGVNCSECAGGHGSPEETTQQCLVTPIANTNPQQYRAAHPQWSRTIQVQSYSTTNNFGRPKQMPNVSNTCGCPVL